MFRWEQHEGTKAGSREEGPVYVKDKEHVRPYSYFCWCPLQEIKCHLITFYPTELKVWDKSPVSILDTDLSFEVQSLAPSLGFCFPQKFSSTGRGGRRLFHESYLNADFCSGHRTLHCKWEAVHVWLSLHTPYLGFF